ncbi:luc7-like protein 3 [Uranotaenia lowii]|uniref:luc7-like protein 3 n=1 Tax=Uranotaenia lowii TaxID=190385 RepID=UPI00247AA83C|nr:luc7-like protein 3 [Uranotaenia lowii]XP_055595915.1 luc7-like protein 3 [Uranotaenia lowii]XP_055595918.1 luc7-like protein 3 [Uranotaenia lowii]XP_055595919.1 luc7-like protein 3 [Uranotaenia lowii]
MDVARQLLDELMGRNRNLDPSVKGKELNWEDEEFCTYFMVKFCPHDLFVNTRADLGQCAKLHDEEAKKLFDNAKPCRKKIQYEEDFLRFCSNMINEVDRKIMKGKQRLLLMNSKLEARPVSKHQDQINNLTEKINKLLREAEEAGIRGDVEQAQSLMQMSDQLIEEKDALMQQHESNGLSVTAEIAAAQEKQMEVCEVCGAFLIVGDAQQRIDDHLTGKQHLGYSKLRKAVEEMLEAKRKGSSRSADERRREEVDHRRDRRRDERRSRERDDRYRRDDRRDDRRKDRRDTRERDHERYDRRDRERNRDRRDHKRSERHRSRSH